MVGGNAVLLEKFRIIGDDEQIGVEAAFDDEVEHALFVPLEYFGVHVRGVARDLIFFILFAQPGEVLEEAKIQIPLGHFQPGHGAQPAVIFEVVDLVVVLDVDAELFDFLVILRLRLFVHIVALFAETVERFEFLDDAAVVFAQHGDDAFQLMQAAPHDDGLFFKSAGYEHHYAFEFEESALEQLHDRHDGMILVPLVVFDADVEHVIEQDVEAAVDGVVFVYYSYGGYLDVFEYEYRFGNASDERFAVLRVVGERYALLCGHVHGVRVVISAYVFDHVGSGHAVQRRVNAVFEQAGAVSFQHPFEHIRDERARKSIAAVFRAQLGKGIIEYFSDDVFHYIYDSINRNAKSMLNPAEKY